MKKRKRERERGREREREREKERERKRKIEYISNQNRKMKKHINVVLGFFDVLENGGTERKGLLVVRIFDKNLSFWENGEGRGMDLGIEKAMQRKKK